MRSKNSNLGEAKKDEKGGIGEGFRDEVEEGAIIVIITREESIV